MSTAAQAAVTVNKGFSPASIVQGDVSTLTITVANSSAGSATSTALTDSLPSGVIVASPSNLSNTCGGTVTATAGSGSVSLSGGTIAPNGGTCTITLNVTSSTVGSYTNTIPAGGVTSSQGSNAGGTSASLNVTSLVPLTVTASTGILGGQYVLSYGSTTTMTITLSNSNNIALTGVTQPFQLDNTYAFFASPANFTTTCGGTVAANSGSTTQGSLTGATIPANGSCTITFSAQAATNINYVGCDEHLIVPASGTGGFSSDQPETSPGATAGVCVAGGAGLYKSFSPGSIVPGGTTTLSFAVYNRNGLSMSGINFTDSLPSGMTLAGAPTTTCAGATVSGTVGGNTLQFSNGSLAAATPGNATVQCAVTVPVTADNTTCSSVIYNNTVADGTATGTNATVGAISVPFYGSSAGVTVVPNQLYGAKVFNGTGYAGNTNTATVTLYNPTSSPATVTSFSDDLTSMASSGITIGASGAATTCAGGTVSAPSGGTLVTMSGGVVPAASGGQPGSCTITIPVHISAALLVGEATAYYNTIKPSQIQASIPVCQQNISGGITAYKQIAANKTFSPTSVIAGGISTVTITAGNRGNTDPASAVGWTDSLPSGMVVAPTPNFTITGCGSGTVSGASAGSTNLSLSGATVAAAGSCIVTFDVQTAASTPNGTVLSNQVTNVVSGNNAPLPGVTARLSVFNSNTTVAKSFTPSTLSSASGTVQLNFIVSNVASSAVALSNVTISDSLPAGMVVANPANASVTGTGCSKGTVSAVSGSGTVSLSGASIAVSGQCSIKVDVSVSAAGSLTNTIPAGAMTSAQGVTSGNTAVATLLANGTADLAITKTANPTGTVGTGGTVTYTIVASNNGPDAVTGATVADTPPSGVTFTSWTCVASSGATCTASGSGAVNDSVSLAKGATATYTVQAKLAPNYSGSSVTNTATITQPGTVADPNPNNNSASATNAVVPGVTLNVTKSDGQTTYTPGGTATYTIVLTNTGSVPATNVNVTDTLPAGVTMSNQVGCTPAGTATCGQLNGGTAGATQFSLTGMTIANGAANQLTISVPVKFASNLATSTVTNTVNVQDVPSGATATASDSDTIAPVSDVAVVKSGPSSVKPGAPISYTLTISNAGPSDANGTTFSDTVPSTITGVTSTCGSATGGAVCPTSIASGNAVSGTIPNLPVGGSVVITISGTASSTNGAPITNTATVAPPNGTTDTNTANNTSTVKTTILSTIGITKTADTSSLVPGGVVHYTVTVTNPGAAAADGTSVNDPIPTGIASQTWTCAATGGAVCAASGNGAVLDTLTAFPGGSSAVYTVTATVSATPPATVTNTASATPPTGGTCSPGGTAPPCTASVTSNSVPLVQISKTADVTSASPSGTVHYTITVHNAGAVAANGTAVSDPIPTGIASQTWTCAGSGGATCAANGTGAVSDTLATFPAGSSATYTVTATVTATPPASISNTATATPPTGGLCTPGNKAGPCTATVDLTSAPTIHITKTADATSLVPGGTVHYTITVTNSGSVAADSVLVTDPVAAGIASQTWTCAASGGATCAASGNGAINDTIATLPVGGSAVYTVIATISNTPPNNVMNTATATTPNNANVCAPANTPAPCSASASIPPVPQVGISKTADVTKVTAGGTIHYTIVVSNTGVVSADNTPVSDPIPTGITSQTWTCVGSSGAACGAANGTGAITDTIGAFPAGSFATYTVTAIVSATPPASITNTATATPTGGALCTPGNTAPPCSATATVSSNPQITIAKSADTSTLVPGGTVHYTVTVTNNGAVAANGTTVSDPIPTGIASQTWTCAAHAGATCAASGTGAISDTIATFPAGSFVTYAVTATVDAAPPATVINTASATPPAGGTCAPDGSAPPCTAKAIGTTAPRISIAKTADATTVAPNGTVHYTIKVSNTGAAAANGTTVSDAIPTGIASQTWTCVGSSGATCTASGTGAVSDTLATFPAGSFVTYTVTATVDANPPATVSNTASADPSNSGVCAPNNTAGPCTATVNLGSVPLVNITKSVDKTTVLPNDTIHYTVKVTNSGTVAADGTTVSDAIPTGIASQIWTCAASGGATCAASGTGAVSDTLATFPVGSSVTYTVTATVNAAPPASITNTATATPPAGGLCAPGATAAPCKSAVTIGSAPRIGITKTADTTHVAPNGTVHYTVTVSNAGSVAANGTIVSDPIPTGIASQTWTCAAAGGATCAASGTGAVSDTIATFPSGSFVTYTVTATANATPPATVTNTASATPPSGVCAPGNTAPPCTATVNLSAVPLIGITKTADVSSVYANGTIHYTVTVNNGGVVAANGTTVSDPIPTGIASQTWTCAASGGATCAASGTGALSDTLATFPAGSSVTYTVTATVDATPPTSIANVANATPPTNGLCLPGNTQPPCAATVNTAASIQRPQVGIAKTADVQSVTAGDTIHYTVTVTNSGAVAANGASVSDPIPAGIASQTWTCAASGGATCTASGSGALSDMIATFPVGSSVTYTVTAKATNTNSPSTITNVATTTPPTNGTCSPCSATVTSSVQPASPPVPTPMLGVWAMVLLSLSMTGMVWLVVRRGWE